MTTNAELEQRIKYHRPDDHGIHRIALMRTYALNWSRDILADVPPGREQDIALTKIEEALAWANAGIARDPEHWDAEQPVK